MLVMGELLEAAMLISFGLSWPLNAFKSYKSGTAEGANWQFFALITLGYLAGVAAKFVTGNINWVLFVYFLNIAFVLVNWAIYVRNTRLDAQRASELVQTTVMVRETMVA